MAEQAEREDDFEEPTDDEPEAEQPEVDEEEGESDDQDEDEESEPEVTVTFGDEAAPASDEDRGSGLVRKLRAEIRDRDAQIVVLRKGDKPQVVEVGQKPTLEACDYDEGRFETELDAWKDRKAKSDGLAAQAQKDEEARSKAWADEIEDFNRKKTALKTKDFDAAEEEVVSTLSQVQQAIVIKATENSAAVIYALGKHPQKLAALAAIEDPIKFAVAVSKLEGTIKVTTRRKAPEPEGIVRGSAPHAKGSDKHLERLEAKADRTGDRTELIRYRKSLKTKS